MKTIFSFGLFMFFLSSFTLSQNKDNSSTLAKTIAENYGVNSWPNITSISFTFNVKNEKINVKRSWKWEPQTGDVHYSGADQNGKDTTVTYNRNSMDRKNDLLTSIDKKFINDSYWLLFPFHLVWDNNVDIKDEGQKELPIGHGKGKSLVVEYKNNVGYTPNDVFVLFLDKNNMIKEWIYKPGGSKEKQRPSTWEGNKKLGGITISTNHADASNKFRVWFTDVKVETDHK
jgi:hypothetical protein